MPANYRASSTAVDMNGLLTSTFEHLEKKGAYFDAISKKTALVDKIRKNKNFKEVSGTGVEVNLMYGLNDTYGSHKPYSILPTNPQDKLGQAFYHWALHHILLTIDNHSLRQNAGPEKIADLLDTKYKQSMITVATEFNRDLWDIENATISTSSPRTDPTTGGSRVISVPLIVMSDADAASNLGGLSAATYPWWRNIVIDFGTTNTFLALKQKMLQLYTDTEAEGLGPIDLMVMDKYTYMNYVSSVEAQRRYSAGEAASAGTSKVKYLDVTDVIWDINVPDCDNGGSAPNGTGVNYPVVTGTWTSGSIYGLNTTQLGLRALKGANWAWQGFEKNVDQDARVNTCLWEGQLVCTNRRCHGLIHGISASSFTS